MQFILPKMGNEENVIRVDEYARRTELITKAMLEGWLTDREIWEYCEGIVKNAEPFNDKGAILWTVDDPSYMPADARVEWAYEPTYNIVAFMIKAYWKMPRIMEDMPGFKEALRGGMLASTYRSFEGHGHIDQDAYIRKVCKLFDMAGADQFCDPCFHEDLCPEFSKLYLGYLRRMEKIDSIAACRGDIK